MLNFAARSSSQISFTLRQMTQRSAQYLLLVSDCDYEKWSLWLREKLRWAWI